MAEITGYVSHIVYRNEENGYTVFDVTLTKTDADSEEERGSRTSGSRGAGPEPEEEVGQVITCVGYPASISEGESCVVEGDYVTHPVYGDQLKARSYSVIAPEDAEAVYRYLASGSIKGIRQALAAKIVKKFGDDTFRVMEEEPERLAQIKGISLRMAREIGAQMTEKKDLRDAMVFLQKYGIGSAHAVRIWKAYGMGTYEVLRTNPYRLAEEIRGIGFATADEIAKRIGIRADSQYRIRSGILFVLFTASGEGHSFLPEDELVQRSRQLLGLPAEEIIIQLENLAVERRLRILHRGPKDVFGKIGASENSFYGVLSGQQADQPFISGEDFGGKPELDNTGLPVENIGGRPELAGAGPLDSEKLEVKLSEQALPCTRVDVYLAGVYRREQEIAHRLLDLDAQIRRTSGDSESLREMEKKIARLEKEEDIRLDPLQREAVMAAASNAVLIITGGPGTGKTTTINTIIRFFMEEDLNVLLAAPTGRASRRMSEATGYPAMTIHRMLGVRSVDKDEDGRILDSWGEDSFGFSAGTPENGEAGDIWAGDRGSGGRKEDRNRKNYSVFERDEDNPLEADVVIIDEMSMVDMNLFHSLLRAVPPGARLIMVGDVNQLPSVGPGCVLQDLIDSGAFHTIMLRHVFRQASESDIVMNAHRILQGNSLSMDNKSRDFFFLERDQIPVIYKHTVLLIREKLPKYVGCRPEDIQVLTPMRRGSLGVEQLNAVLQSVLNPPKKGREEYKFREIVFREGDKVMQTRNNYSLEWEIRGNYGMPIDRGTGIFNGDFGKIMEIDLKSETMTVCFDEARTVEYPFSGLEDLDLAYAVTVHKSQGSEYPAVILPLLAGPSALFNRNLLYTAVTRAKKAVVVVGSRGAVDKMIANVRRSQRYTGLRDRVLEASAGQAPPLLSEIEFQQ